MKALFVTAILLLTPAMGLAQQVTKPAVDGIRNLAKLETTVACAGATDAAAMPEIKRMGFVSVINLREAGEEGANVEAGAAAAKAAGLKYFHVPFNGQAPTASAADQFIAAVTAPGAEPAFIHCAGGNRAATMWLIKRLVVDRWPEEKAIAEAVSLGQTSATQRQFALDYARARTR
jgi:uncharacterized protein (TIGR01244 family)